MEKLFDAELRLMEFVWENEPISAKKIAAFAEKDFNWNKNTTYTVIKRLVEKKVLKRTEPNFICSCVVKREQAQKSETDTLIKRLFGGSKKAFFAAFADEELSAEEVDALKTLLEKKG